VKKRGKIYGIIGLFLGLILGGGFLYLQGYIAEQLVSLIRSEVEKSCNCEFKVDQVNVSLLTLSAQAENARITEQGQNSLFFKRIKLTFGLSELSEKTLILSRLDLIEGFSHGVGSDSATYKFIEQLTTPLPPELRVPDRWRIKLMALRIVNSDFIEPLGKSQLVANGVGLNLTRTSGDDFLLKPIINSLTYKESESKDIIIGKTQGHILIKDHEVLYDNFSLTQKDTSLSAKGVSDSARRSALMGTAEYKINTEALSLDSFLKGFIHGKAVLAGRLARPEIKGRFVGKPLEVVIDQQKYFDLQEVEGDLLVSFTDHGIKLKVSDLAAHGPELDIKSLADLDLDSKKVAGQLAYKIKSLSIAEHTLRNLNGSLSISGGVEDFKLETTGELSELESNGLIFKNLTYKISDYQKETKVELSLGGNGEMISTLFADFGRSIDNQPLKIKRFDFNLNRLSFASKDLAELEQIYLSGKGSLVGELAYGKLRGTGDLNVSSRYFAGESALAGNFNLGRTDLRIQLENNSKSIKAELNIPNRLRQEGVIKFRLNNFKPEEYDPELECIKVSLNAEYNFTPKNFTLGNGFLDWDETEFGCDPFTVKLIRPVKVKINSGNLVLPEAVFKGSQTDIKLKGDISAEQIKLQALGAIQLKSLLGLLPILDDLQGQVEVSLGLEGPTLDPILSGSANIKNSELSIEKINLSANEINGRLLLKDRSIIVQELLGQINQGSVVVSGQIVPFRLHESALKIDFTKINSDYSSELQYAASGSLEFKHGDDGKPQIAGNINLDELVYRKDINFKTAVRQFTSLFNRQSAASVASAVDRLPNWGLDLSLSANRNIFIVSNLLEAELKGSLLVQGTLADPILNGSLQTLYGSFGLKNSRFDITSAVISIKPASMLPYLELLAETTVTNRMGEPTYVVMEGRGAINSPIIRLTSDNNLTESEILTLLTARGLSRAQTKASGLAADRFRSGIKESESGTLGLLFSTLDNFDSLTIEPAFNRRTGLIEPTLFASKKLGSKFRVSSESFFGGSTSDSRFRADYDLSTRLMVSGIVDTVSTQKNTSLGADLTYTFLSKRIPYLVIDVKSDQPFKSQEILDFLRLNEDSKVPVVDLAQLQEDLNLALKRFGYLDGEAHLTCEENLGYCRKLTLEFMKVKLFNLEDVIFQGDPLPESVKIKPIVKKPTKANLDQYLNRVLMALRSEGYLRSRVSGEYQKISSDAVNLVVNLEIGSPVSFIFKGLKYFKPEELLKTINLYERKQPFGNNTINILLTNIERLYREHGFLFATFTYTTHIDQTGREVFTVNINEEVEVDKFKAKITGLTPELDSELRQLADLEEDQVLESIFSPDSAIMEQVETNVYYLKELLIEKGYAKVEVEYRIDPDEENIAWIEYHVLLGERLHINSINVSGYPLDVSPPQPIDAPYSIAYLNRYLSVLLDDLNVNGYLAPAFQTDFNFELNSMNIVVEPGSATKLGTVTCQGNNEIKCDDIVTEVNLEKGSRYNQNQINQAKTKLLRLGLFSSISIEPVDGKIDSLEEDFAIIVVERSLRSLDIGVGANSELGLHFFAEATDKAIFKDGRAINLILDAYYDNSAGDISQGVAGLRYVDPYFLKSNYKATTDLGYQKYENPTLEYNLDRVFLDNTLHRSWGNGIGLALGHTVLHENLDQVSPGAVLSELDIGDLNLSYLYGSLAYDLRDDPINPRSGLFIGFDYKVASKSIGSDAEYIQLGGRASWLLPFGDSPFTLANNTAGGVAWGYGDTEEIPISQRYYLGGRTTLRGFRENSLGPRGVDGAVIGGDYSLSNNFEVRYLNSENFATHLFWDAGNVFLQDLGAVDLDELRHSIGFGFRYLSPVGPIGFDFGHPLDEQPGEPSWRMHFSVGSVF
jgi:outer membrane protein insertion porin family